MVFFAALPAAASCSLDTGACVASSANSGHEIKPPTEARQPEFLQNIKQPPENIPTQRYDLSPPANDNANINIYNYHPNYPFGTIFGGRPK